MYGLSPKLAFSGLEKLRGFFSSRLLANMCPNNKIYWDLTLCLKAKLVLCCNGVLQKLIPSCFVGVELTPLDFRNQQVCSVDFPKFLIFFDDHVGLPQGSLEPKNRRPKPHWSGAGAVSIFGPNFTYIN